MILNINQINELLEIIKKQHILFLTESVGADFLSKEDKKILQNSGFNLDKLKKMGVIEENFRLGLLADALGHKKARILNYEQFKKFVSSGAFYPLTKAETEALQNVKLQNYTDIKGLGNRISSDFTRILVDSDKKKRAKFLKIIKQEAQQAIIDRSTVQQLASNLMHKTKDWARDFERIADYTMHEAFSQGKIQRIRKTRGDNADIYMEVLSDACPDCRKLYLNGDGTPKVFKLWQLLNNGSNIGRKKAEWKAVVPPLHPWCRCETFEKPEDYEYNIVTHLFDKPPKDYVSPVGRTSKVRVFINEKEIE